MEVAQALELLNAKALDRPETFYGADAGLSVGVGLILDRVEFPIFDGEADRFAVHRGLALVLSHECDLANERLLGTMSLICPITSIEGLLDAASATGVESHYLGAFIGNLARRDISRAVYFPPIEAHLPNGGFVYLNQITSTTVARLQAADRVCALTGAGLTALDKAMENHLLRPKSEALPLQQSTFRRGTSIFGKFGRRNDRS